MAPTRIKEIQAILHLLHRDCVLLSAVLEDELLEEKERPFVRDLLADLNHRLPGVFRGKLRAVRTLPVLDEELDLEHLFENRRGEDLLLDREGYAEAFGMGLGPDEVGVGEADLVEALELFQAECEQFPRLRLCDCPRCWR